MLFATRTVSISLTLLMLSSAAVPTNAAQTNATQPNAVQPNATADKFAQEVEQKCTDAVGELFRRPMIAVDPSGTESYGVAIVYGRSKELKGPAAVICVIDKKTGKVEIGAPLGKEVVRVRKPKPEGQENGKQNKQNKKMQNQSNTGNVGSQDDGDDDQQ